MRNILVIQLERLGDVIQSTPLLCALAQAQPSVRIDVIVAQGNEVILTELAGLDRIYTLPSAAIRSQGSAIETVIRARRLAEVETIAQPVLAALDLPDYDQIINLSHDYLSAWLATRVRAGHREGALIDTQGQWRYAGAAHAYLIAMLDFRDRNRFNLVDLYRTSATVQQPTPQARPSISIEQSLLPPAASKPYIALNPGASRLWKQWPAECYAELAGLLSKQGCTPILVGSPADQEVCTQVAALADLDLLNYSGQSSVPQMAGILEACELLIGNDTGAVHIAAAVGTPVIGLYGATYFAETAPWGEGHWLVQTPFRHEDADWNPLTPAIVAQAAAVRLGLSDLEHLHDQLKDSPIEIWETAFLSPDKDPLGGLHYRPIHAAAQDYHGLNELIRGLLARFFLPNATSFSSAVPALKMAPAPAKQLRQGLQKALAQLDSLAAIATSAVRCCALRDPTQAGNLRALTQQLSVGLDELDRLSEIYVDLTPLLHTLNWQLRMLPEPEPMAYFLEHMQSYHRLNALLAELDRHLADLV